MLRPWRVEYAGACYHVINRGNYRRDLFRSRGSAAAFERTLDEAAKRFGWQIHAYVVMSTHFHLALALGEPNLSHGMKWLQGTWIRRYNGFRRLIGRPFQGRYKALLVEPGEALGRVCHYIHLNPVRAGLVAPAAVGEYPWSSLPKFLQRTRPAWLNPVTVLGEAGGLADARAGWQKYLGYLEFLAEDDASRKTLVADQLSRGWCVGSAAFRQQVRQDHLLRGAEHERYAGLEPEAIQAEQREAWENRLLVLARLARIDLVCLSARKSHPNKVLLAAALKQSTSVSNSWLAERLGMGRPSSVPQFTCRLMRTPTGAAQVRQILSKVET
jgi:putative transposase